LATSFAVMGNPRLILPILARIIVERQHRVIRDALCPPKRVHHDEHLHQMMVGRRTRRLHNVDILARTFLINLDECLAVGKRVDRALPVRSDGCGNGLGQGRFEVPLKIFTGRFLGLPENKKTFRPSR